MAMLKVSVILPTRNRPLLLEAALQSVLGQTHPVHEILVVDDGSEPCHQPNLEALAATSPRIRLLRQGSCQGVSAARNRGLEEATGDALLFLDDDDLLLPAMVETCGAKLEADPGLGVVACLAEVLFAPGPDGWLPLALLFDPRLLEHHPLRGLDGGNPLLPGHLERDPGDALLRSTVPIHTCLVRRSAVGDLRFPVDLRQGEDTCFWLRVARRGCRFHRVDACLALVRRHGGNTTRSRRAYFRDIPACYHRILREGLVTTRRDRFLVSLKLAYFAWRRKDGQDLSHGLRVLACPDLLVRVVWAFLGTSLALRRRLLKYYFQD